jgi:hypothetical protein
MIKHVTTMMGLEELLSLNLEQSGADNEVFSAPGFTGAGEGRIPIY